ncbi:MAG: hypothetical protein IBX50_12620 [Marinospirillum sp.]|uniref:hypothetical protein n=1 Tax=Marinospirillum sp. TaxID=2183934 RepID=UPI0019E302F5|nr:hypothetical protein [Marinospirillum sp.]MBE0507539.1 hypothetical protein [Marinospirillum sp.]
MHSSKLIDLVVEHIPGVRVSYDHASEFNLYVVFQLGFKTLVVSAKNRESDNTEYWRIGESGGHEFVFITFTDPLHLLPYIVFKLCSDTCKVDLDISPRQLLNIPINLSENSHIAITDGVISFRLGTGDLHVNIHKESDSYHAYIAVLSTRYKISFTDPRNVFPLISYCFGSVFSDFPLSSFYTLHSLEKEV